VLEDFSQDLLYRLNAVTIHLPPLRERREDIRPLANYFAGRTIGPMLALVSFFQRSNVLLARELRMARKHSRVGENAVVRAVALCDQIVRPEDLPERVRRSYRAGVSAAASGKFATWTSIPAPMIQYWSLAELERRHITRVLSRTGGNKQAAARILGIDRTTYNTKET
jgi:DNA-binding NtrC family response regulator